MNRTAGVTDRLRTMSRLSNLRTSERLAAKVNLGAAAVTRRLRRLSELRDCCLRLARWGRYWPVSSADGP